MPEQKVIARRQADDDHEVVSVESGHHGYRRQPCGGCPWRVDQTGAFPAEAFGHSARTAYDLSKHAFGCHESGTRRTATCAGFLLRGAADNLAVRMAVSRGRISLAEVDDGGHELHADYRAMAVANGLDPADPRLRPCRGVDRG